jgi:hypothetical protein
LDGEVLGDFVDFLLPQNFEYLTKPEKKAEPLVPLDENTRKKLHEMLKNPDNDVDTIIMWIQVSVWVDGERGGEATSRCFKASRSTLSSYLVDSTTQPVPLNLP